ncbi:lytic murein transglycosylase [Shewanella marina]|uniref:lytic murein transglycosylase n=1 Tax=Shewanella marina TaxID=487319 RepID=UPI00047123A0|nr:lytic murein transglycosylase [Shewanella marina]
MKKFFPFASLVLCHSLVSAPVFAADDFSQCVAQLKKQAAAEGLKPDTVAALDQVKLIHRAVKFDRKQPEFSTPFNEYYGKRVTDWRVQKGRQLLNEYRPLLTKLTKEYGVPAQYLVAFWGLETNFGSYKGKMPVLDSLATLACDHRRSQFFTTQLMEALKLKQEFHFSADKMVGSWAGAVGHTQFMPSTYMEYAVDGDGDGVIDLWDSTPDALTSAANFLSKLGWKRDERWGREVKLPENFDFTHLGAKQKLPLKEWAKLGLTQANGWPLATPDMEAALYLPLGHAGPAFLAYANFDVIMRWNRSVFYAISVGELANQINGGGKIIAKMPDMPRVTRDTYKLMQQKLDSLGYNVGKPDGILGAKSKAGIRQFQKSKGLVADGFPDVETLKALGITI